MPRPLASAKGAYDGYYTQRTKRSPLRRWLRGALDLTRRRYMDRSTPSSAHRLLDFGCGDGGYLDRVAGADRICFGTDLIEPRHRDSTWTWLETSDLESTAPFDWITLGHVVEHMADPAAAISHLSTRLAPGAALWIATPNADSFLFKCAGRWARDVDYPRHLTIFSRQSLENLVNREGLTATFSAPPRLNAVLNTISSLRNMLRANDAPLLKRITVAVMTLAALTRHTMQTRGPRDQTSPELVVICRLSSSVPPPAQ